MTIHTPNKTYVNRDDGNTYYFAPLEEDEKAVLWACPTDVDGSADLVSAIPETDFAEPLDKDDRARIVTSLTD